MAIQDAFRLDSKVALVTGANQGLGQAMAVGLAEAGADVVTLDRTPDCEDTRSQVEALERRSFNVTCDLLETSAAGLNQVVDQIVAEMGRLDILVNNAGIIRRSPALEFTEHQELGRVPEHLLHTGRDFLGNRRRSALCVSRLCRTAVQQHAERETQQPGSVCHHQLQGVHDAD